MYNGAYSLSIPEGREDRSGYVRLAHKEQYRIRLGNSSYKACDVQVDVDGKTVGTFRLNGYQTVTLERPTNDKGKFTFLLDGSDDAEKAGLNQVSKANKGVISATFMPERTVPKPVTEVRPSYGFAGDSGSPMIGSADVDHFGSASRGMATKGLLSSNAAGYKSGGTGLSGKSGQSYYTVDNLEYDGPDTFVTLVLRLVGSDENEVRSLKSVSNNVPPPVN